MKEFIISQNDCNQRLDRFIAKTFDNLPHSLMYKEIRKKNIKINKKRCTPEQILNEGDLLQLYLNDDVLHIKKKHYDFVKASSDLDIVYEDNNIIVLNKPQGLLCHPDGKEYVDTLIARVKRYLYENKSWNPQDSTFTPALANRIDRNTSGLVIAAKNGDALREMTKLIKEHNTEKYYLAFLDGIPKKRTDTLVGWITKDDRHNMVKISENEVPHSKQAITKYKVLNTQNGFALVEVQLLTGRTHQIRAQMAAIGCPLAGDGKYGKIHGRYRQQLFSYRLVIHAEPESMLHYLNNKEIKADPLPFEENFYKSWS